LAATASVKDMSAPHAVLASIIFVSPVVVALPNGLIPTYYVVKHSADGACEVTTVKPRRPGYAIMGDLHFTRKEHAVRAAREHCRTVSGGATHAS